MEIVNLNSALKVMNEEFLEIKHLDEKYCSEKKIFISATQNPSEIGEIFPLPIGEIVIGCNPLFHDKLSNLEKIIGMVITYSEKYKKFFYTSIGYEGGCTQISTLRVKLTSKEIADESEYVNKVIRNKFPENVPYGIRIGNFFVSENFEGKKLCEYKKNSEEIAPKEIIFEHLKMTDYISKIKIDVPERKEVYAYKMTDVAMTLKKFFRVSKETSSQYVGLAQLYEKAATERFWDRSLQNAKYSTSKRKTSLMQMPDWGRVKDIIVPLYENVQIACTAQQHYGEIKDLSRHLHQDMSEEDFKKTWEMSRLYYLTRQLRHAAISGEEFLIKKNIDGLSAENFEIFTIGNRILEDINKNLQIYRYNTP